MPIRNRLKPRKLDKYGVVLVDESGISRERTLSSRTVQLRKYGIDEAEYARMLKQQDGLCAICRKNETMLTKGQIRNLAVDHCHTTNVIRGLLCSRCNTAIGLFGDDITLLRNAILYLKKHKSI